MPVRLEKEGAVGILVLDRPPANSYDYAFLRSFAGAIDDARSFDKYTSGQANVVNPGLAVDVHAQLAGHGRLKTGSTFKQAARQAHVPQGHRDVADEHGARSRVVLETVGCASHP